MTALLTGIITGFLMVVPIGPINLSVISKVINHRRWAGFRVGLGGAVMDTFYLFALMSGFSAIDFNPNAMFSLKLTGILFLLAYGIYELVRNPNNSRGGFQFNQSARNDFFLGIFLYVSNPVLVATLSGLAAFIQALQVFPNSFTSNGLFALGAGAGSAGWYALLVWIVHSLKQYQTSRFLTLTNKACGIALILIAIYLSVTVTRDFLL